MPKKNDRRVPANSNSSNLKIQSIKKQERLSYLAVAAANRE